MIALSKLLRRTKHILLSCIRIVEWSNLIHWLIVNNLAGLFASLFTYQRGNKSNLQIKLANIVVFLASKSKWDWNSRINSNNSDGQFVRQNCIQICRFLICSPTLENGKDAVVVSWSESKKDNPQAGLNISILLYPQSSKPTKSCRTNTTFPWKQGKVQ